MATAAVALALGLASSSTAPMPKVTRDLRAFWPFQEPTGSPKIDSVHGCVESPEGWSAAWALHSDTDRLIKSVVCRACVAQSWKSSNDSCDQYV